MDEPVRLACPRCDLAYRLKRLTPGKAYTCKNCGGALVNPDALPHAHAHGAAAPAALSSSSAAASPAYYTSTAQFISMNERLSEELKEFSGSVGQRLDELGDSVTSGVTAKLTEEFALRLAEIESKLSRMDELKDALREQREAFEGEFAALADAEKRGLDDRLAARFDAHAKEMRLLLAPAKNKQDDRVEVNIDDLADRLVAGVRGRGSFLDADSESAIDAMARIADELVREQNANSLRLDKLADEIRAATSGISKLEEWRGELPERVADEIGQTVEARVVGPISDTLTRQAPAILSEWHDNKLVDLVSRSVREAQRPLLREILAGGRRGVPLWLFASVLLPLLLVLGYLFLPGDYLIGREPGENTVLNEDAAESLARIESGMNIVADNEDRLRNIEDAVLDIHGSALEHVKNAASLEEEIKHLNAAVAERDSLLNEYKDTLQKQVKRLQAYEMRLVQLGVSPKSIAE